MKAPGKGCLQASRAASAAGASKKKSKDGGKAEATMDGKRTERVGQAGKRVGGVGAGKGELGGGGQEAWAGLGAEGRGRQSTILGLIYGFTQTHEPPLTSSGRIFGHSKFQDVQLACVATIRANSTTKNKPRKQTFWVQRSSETRFSIFSRGFANILQNQADEGQLLFSRWA